MYPHHPNAQPAKCWRQVALLTLAVRTHVSFIISSWQKRSFLSLLTKLCTVVPPPACTSGEVNLLASSLVLDLFGEKNLKQRSLIVVGVDLWMKELVLINRFHASIELEVAFSPNVTLVIFERSCVVCHTTSYSGEIILN